MALYSEKYYKDSFTAAEEAAKKKQQKKSGSSAASSGKKTGSYKLSAETYNKYETEYNNWKKTGKYSSGFQSNASDFNTWKTIRDIGIRGGKSALIGDTYYAIDDDTYDRYEREYNNWKKTGKYSDDVGSWNNPSDFEAWKSIRDYGVTKKNAGAQQLSGLDWLNGLDQDVLDRVRTAYQDSLVWDITDPEDMARKAAGQMPKSKDSYYNLKDPLDAYLYEQGLPSNKSDYLSKQYQKYLAEVEGEREEEAAYTQSFDRFKDVFFQTKQKFPDMADEDIIAQIFRADTDGSYQEVANNLLRKGRENPEEMSGLDFIEWYENQDDRKENPREFTIQDLVDEYQQIYGTAPETIEEAVEGVAEAEGASQTAPAIFNYTALATPENAEDQLKKVETMLADMRSGFNGYERQIRRPADPDEAKRYDSLMLQSQQLQQMIAQRDLDEAKEKLAGYDDVPVSDVPVTQAAGSMSREERKAISEILDDPGFGRSDAWNWWFNQDSNLRDPNAYQTQAAEMGETNLSRYYTSKFMTEEEKGRFSYIVENQGAKAALEYWDALEPILNERNYAQANAEIEKAVADYPGLASIGTIFAQIPNAVEGVVVQASGWANVVSGGKVGREVTFNDPRLVNTYTSTGIRSGVSEEIAATQGQLLAIAYDMGLSIVDNAFRVGIAAVTGGAGVAISSATMYGSAAASVTSQYLQEGASAKQALLMGTISGATEAIGEAIDLSQLFALKDVGDLAKAVGGNMTKGQLIRRALIRQALTEGGSESATEIANMVADMIVMQDEADVMKLYNEALDNGATKGQALWHVVSTKLGDVAIAGIGGAISGIVLGGGGIAIQGIKAGRAAGENGTSTLSKGLQYMTDEANATARLRIVYEGAVKDGTAMDPGTRMQILSDLQTVGLDKKLAEQYGETLDKFMASPRNLSSDEFLTLMNTVKKDVLAAGDAAREISIDQKARRDAANQRLTGQYNALMEMRDQARAALEAGDLKTHAKLLNQISGKMQQYTEAYANEQRKEETAQAHDDLKQEKANRAVVEDMNELSRREAAETAYQAEQLATAAAAEAAVSEVAPAQDGSETFEPVTGSPDTENAVQGESEVLTEDLLEAEEADAEPASRRNVIKDFDSIDYMVNGEKGEANGEETERNVLGTEPVRTDRGEGDHRSRGAGKEQRAADEAGRARWAESRRSGTLKWGWRQNRDIRNAIEQYNREAGTQISRDAVRQAQEVPKNLLTAARILKVVTGRDVFFIESDERGFGGFSTRDGKNRYVVVTGNLVTDIFNVMHESAHHMPEVQRAILSLLDNGIISRREFNAYKDQRRERVADNRGVDPRSVNLGPESDLRVEFACDMAGAYADNALLNKDMWAEYGISPDNIQRIKDAIDDALSIGGVSEEEAGAEQKAYATLSAMGAAISAEDAEGAEGVWFSARSSPANSIKNQIRSHEAELNQMAPVKRVSMSDISAKRKRDILQDLLGRFGKNHIISRQGYGDVHFGGNQIDNGLKHIDIEKNPEEVAVFYAIPSVIKQGIVVGTENDHQGVKQRTITFAGPVNINISGEDVRVNVGVVVIEERKNHYHAHRVLMPDGSVMVLDKNKTAAGLVVASPFGKDVSPAGAVSELSIRNESGKVNAGGKSSQFDFSQNAAEGTDEPLTLKQSRLMDAYNLYEQGYDPVGYYQMDPDTYDQKTANLLRGIMLRNGENVGGALSEDRMGYVKDIFSRAVKVGALKLTGSSPARIWEDVLNWKRGKTAQERAEALKDTRYLSDSYYEFGNTQAASREQWVAENRKAVHDAMRNNGEFGQFESSLTQMLGEGIITEDQAKAAVSDGKVFIVPVSDGFFVLDNKSRILYTSDSKSSTRMDEKLRDRIRRDWNTGGLSGLQVKPQSGKPMQMVRIGDTVTIYSDAGEVLAEVKNGTKPNMKAVNATVKAMRSFYDEAYRQISVARLENGYPPPGEIENYFPHQGRLYEGVEGFVDALMSNDLPTSINGLTGMFSPGQPWNANLQQRIGNFTEFDARRGFERYVQAAGDTIFYTPVIQRLRQLERALREQGANALTKEDQNRNSAFVDWLHEQANEWANKKSSFDRGAESLLGREAYTVSNVLTSMVSASSVGGSFSSALSNFIGAWTGLAQIDAKYAAPEAIRTVGQLIQLLDPKQNRYDGFADKIPFMVRRFPQNDEIEIRNVEKLKNYTSKALYFTFSAVDRLAVESVARAKYAECLGQGMTEEEAIRATDNMLIKNFSDRGKGQNARLFNIKWLKPVVQFQNEVMNQMSHFRDIRRETMEQQLRDLEKKFPKGINFDEVSVKRLSGGGTRALKKKISYLVLLSLWGMITRWILGGDQTWNPFGMAVDAVQDYKAGGVKQTAAGLAETVADQAPLVSVLSGGGRIPIAGNISYVTDVVMALIKGEADSLSNADWIKGATAMVPGGGQLRKTLTGLDALNAGGYYTADGKLRYPVTKKDAARVALFGPSAAAPRDYDWSDTLSKDETEQYRKMVDGGMEAETVFDIMLAYGDGSDKAQRALAVATVAEDLPKKEFDLMMEVLGIEPKDEKGSAITQDKYVDWAVEQGQESLEQSRDKYEEGDLTEKTMKKYEAFFEEYFRQLGIAITEGA